MADEWKEVDRNYLKQIIREFYFDRLVSEEENTDGTKTMVLTERGKKKAISFNFTDLHLTP